MEKLHTSKTFSKMAGGRMHTPHLTPDPPLTISYKNHGKSLAYFSHFAPLILFFFLLKGRVKGGGPWHNAPLNALPTALHLFRDMIVIEKESTIASSVIDKLVAFFLI